MEGIIETKEHLCYPVISEAPSYPQIMQNTRPKELGYVGLWTLGSGIFGYARGGPGRMSAALVASSVSLFGGLWITQANSFLRLKGYKENREEMINAKIIDPSANKSLVRVVRRRPLMN
ncbi:predicted protein [Naegleria gruberi]|uniref:Predicted protein n=1 Tax=Naegleria gruberi TaxID=5762 RepID=D2VB67_NAEGR|nr:uncharacterized protein NAEGRDRAFT_66109 [Naegleria gruberi]EFC45854.1 predicted protein [Naegleria gruberi]|eukprot:XP_002678598.1 predicted protein [Naegleria gruberi strain NEG-M]